MDKDETRRVMAKRLNDLMAGSSALNTLKKVAAASGASYGTVKNIRTNSGIDVGIGNVELIAECFGLTLSEFIGNEDKESCLSVQERDVIRNLRAISTSDAGTFYSQIARMAAMAKALKLSAEIRQGFLSESRD